MILVLATGLLGGFASGRRPGLDAPDLDDPDFTWKGTIFIVGGFTLLRPHPIDRRRRPHAGRHGGGSVTAASRDRRSRDGPVVRRRRRGDVPHGRRWRTRVRAPEWPKARRGLCLVVAAGPVLFVGTDLVGSFGWSLHTLAGFAMMLAVYATIIWPPGSRCRPPRRFACTPEGQDDHVDSSPASRRCSSCSPAAGASSDLVPLDGRTRNDAEPWRARSLRPPG